MDETKKVAGTTKNPDLDRLLSFLTAFQGMFSKSSEKYRTTSPTVPEDSAETALLKQLVPIVFKAAGASLSVFSDYLINSPTPQDLLNAITAASADISTQPAIGKILKKIDLRGVDASTFLNYQALLKAVGINDINALTAGLSKIEGIPALLSAMQNVEIQDAKTSDNLKALLKVLKEQLTELFNSKDFKELEKLLDPIIKQVVTQYVAQYTGSTTLGIVASRAASFIARSTPAWICEKIILPRVLGLTNTGIQAKTYTELLGKVVLHVADKFEERLIIDDKRREFEGQLTNTATALATLKEQVQACRQAILDQTNRVDVEFKKLRSGCIAIERNGLLNSLDSRQKELAIARADLEAVSETIGQILENSPAPTIEELKALLEFLPKPTTEGYLGSLPIELIENLEKYILDEEAKKGILASITGTAGTYAAAVGSYVASWWPVGGATPTPTEQPNPATTAQTKTPQPNKIDELLISLQIVIKEKIKTINETLEQNTTLKVGLKDILANAKLLTELSSAKEQLLLLNKLDEKIGAIQTTLDTYRQSALRFFFSRLFRRASYQDYKTIQQELKKVKNERETLEQKVSAEIASKASDPKIAASGTTAQDIIAELERNKQALEERVEKIQQRTEQSRLHRHSKKPKTQQDEQKSLLEEKTTDSQNTPTTVSKQR